MAHQKLFALIALTLAQCIMAAPAGTSTSTALSPAATVAYASDDSNTELWHPGENTVPEPVRGSLGATIQGPQNIPLELQNPSLLAPPTTDSGFV
jgi:hypothetical protein